MERATMESGGLGWWVAVGLGAMALANPDPNISQFWDRQPLTLHLNSTAVATKQSCMQATSKMPLAP